MREIKFRGSLIDNGEWVHGYYIVQSTTLGDITDIIFDGEWEHAVNPETVGQYTGLRDRDGKEIYEGDILRVGDFPVYAAEVVYDDTFGAWGLCRDQIMSVHVGDYNEQDRAVIGNIYEHPHLIGGERDEDPRQEPDAPAEDGDHSGEPEPE